MQEMFYSKRGFFQHKIVFYPTSCIPPSFATEVWLQEAWKKTNMHFFTFASFPKIEKMLLLAIMPSWQIYNQGVTQGREATRRHISLALEMCLLITNTEITKIPYSYLSHTTTTSNMTQKKS